MPFQSLTTSPSKPSFCLSTPVDQMGVAVHLALALAEAVSVKLE